MKVAEAAQTAGVSPHAVRYYVRRGLIRPARERTNGYRTFHSADVARLTFIRQAQRLGFTLAEIARIFAGSETSGVPCPYVRDLIERRLAQIGDDIDELHAMRVGMHRALSSWRHLPDQAPDGRAICELIGRSMW